jgi:hypothetical protein
MERTMNRLNLALHLAHRGWNWAQSRLGIAGLAGVGLVVAALVAWTVATRTQQQTEWLSARTVEARARVAQLPEPKAPDRSDAEQLARFQQWFPSADQSTADLRVIFAAATAAHVELARGEYSVHNVEGSGGLERFDVIFPVKEHYAPVKNFVAEVLNKLPHASLDELRVERPGASADQLDSRVHFTLFYRDGGREKSS